MKTHPPFSGLLQSFFTERLVNQRNASPHTIASYRDTFRLLLEFGRQRLRKPPTTLDVEDWDAPFIGRFLDHLEKDRGNTPRSRNIRLAAPDQETWLGRRDRTLLLVAVQTGLRASELIGLRCQDVALGNQVFSNPMAAATYS